MQAMHMFLNILAAIFKNKFKTDEINLNIFHLGPYT